jgi:hypothetical protein
LTSLALGAAIVAASINVVLAVALVREPARSADLLAGP